MNSNSNNQPHSPYSRIIQSDAVKDPERVYESPKDVVEDNRLDRDDKIKILESWSEDMEALMRAEEENMPATTNKASSKTGEKLRDIREFLRQLQEEIS